MKKHSEDCQVDNIQYLSAPLPVLLLKGLEK
jgi:hypothetical protein